MKRAWLLVLILLLAGAAWAQGTGAAKPAPSPAPAAQGDRLQSVAIFPVRIASGVQGVTAQGAARMLGKYAQGVRPGFTVIPPSQVFNVLEKRKQDVMKCGADRECVSLIGSDLDVESVLTTVIGLTGGGRLKAEVALVHVGSKEVLNQVVLPGRGWDTLGPRLGARAERMLAAPFRRQFDLLLSEDSFTARMLSSHQELLTQLPALPTPLDRMDRIEAFLTRYPPGRFAVRQDRVVAAYNDVKARLSAAEKEIETLPHLDYVVECAGPGEELPSTYEEGRKPFFRVIAPAPETISGLALRRATEACFNEHPRSGCGPCDIVPGLYQPSAGP